MRPLRTVVVLALALFGVCSCRQVIGIEDAQVDPALTKPAPSGGNGSAEPLQISGSGGTSDLAPTNADPSAAGDEATAGGASGGDAGASGSAASVCQSYCVAVTANCTGTFAVYTSYSACMAVCAALPEGQPGDRLVNSVQCRLHAALVASDEVPHYCPIAGPGGNGECGSNCESLCGLREQVCKGFVDPDVAACLSSCKKLPDLATYSTDLEQGEYSGPAVQCRLYHVSAAASDDPAHHCLHVDGAAPCR